MLVPLKSTRRLLSRRKWGQKTWSPNATPSGSAPTTGVSAQEALQIAYRPMPSRHTVEYEEDFGPNLMIHREFVSKRHSEQMTFDISALAYSDTELRRGQQQLADTMNRERRGAALGGGPGASPAAGTGSTPMGFSTTVNRNVVPFVTDVNHQSREVSSARFLFDDMRMAYCERFQNQLRSTVQVYLAHARQSSRGEMLSDDALRTLEESQVLFSLMEACAVIYGCDSEAAREAYFHMFLGLDLENLEREEEVERSKLADALTVGPALHPIENEEAAGAVTPSPSSPPSGLPADDTLFPLPDSSLLADGTAPDGLPRMGDTMDELRRGVAAPPLNKESCTLADQLQENVREFAPWIKAYLAHASGHSPIAPQTLDVAAMPTGAYLERRRWRQLMDALLREEYHLLAPWESKDGVSFPQALLDAVVLNGQLHTMKFFDLKVGDTVREIHQMMARETGDISSVHRNAPAEVSPAHPERRV